MIEAINPHVMNIIISCRKQDSIRAISLRIGLSYGWTYKWVQILIEIGVFRVSRIKLHLNENNVFYRRTLRFLRSMADKNPRFLYQALALFGIDYAFTQTDAVYVWTRGGYNISRYKEYYPIFIQVKNSDKRLFEWYCRKLHLRVKAHTGAFYVVDYTESVAKEYCNDMPVKSLQNTIEFMNQHIYNFQPALEMLRELYPKTKFMGSQKYSEAATNV